MVGNRKEPGKLAAEEAFWGAVFKRLVLWTMKAHRVNVADAEEIAQEGIRQFIAAGGTIDPADLEGLLEALRSRVNGVAVNRRRKKALRAVTFTDDGSPAEPAEPVNPETSVVSDDLSRKAVSALLDRVADDELVQSIVMLKTAGVEDAAEQATELGRPIQDVYNARRRLKTHVEAIEKLMEDW